MTKIEIRVKKKEPWWGNRVGESAVCAMCGGGTHEKRRGKRERRVRDGVSDGVEMGWRWGGDGVERKKVDTVSEMTRTCT